MHITRYTDYSLRVLIYLAIHNDKLCTINDIAQSYQISKNHLMKIVQVLNQQKYLTAIRGKNGGLMLNKPPEEINIGKLVRNFEDKTKLVECFGDNNQCVITPNCQLARIFSEATENFYSTLDTYTLADLVNINNKPQLASILSINIA